MIELRWKKIEIGNAELGKHYLPIHVGIKTDAFTGIEYLGPVVLQYRTGKIHAFFDHDNQIWMAGELLEWSDWQDVGISDD